MYIVVEFVDAQPQHRAALRTALMFLARQTLEKRRGCLHYDVGQDDLDGGSFLLYQVYASRETHTEHIELSEYAEHRLLIEPWTKSHRLLTYSHISGAQIA